MDIIVRDPGQYEEFIPKLEQLTSDGRFDEWLADFTDQLYVSIALENKEPMGWAAYIINKYEKPEKPVPGWEPFEDYGEIGVYVEEQYRGRGIAHELVDKLLNHIYVEKGIEPGQLYASEKYNYEDLAEKYGLELISMEKVGHMEKITKTAAGTGIGAYRRGDVLTDLALVAPGQLVAYESKRFKSVNLCKITETFKDKLYAIFVNPDNPAEKSKSSDEEFVVYPTDLKQGEYYIVLEPSPEQVGEPSKKAKEPKDVMPVAPENPTVSEEAGTPMPTPEGAPAVGTPAVEEAPVTGSKKTSSLYLEDEEDIKWLFDTALKQYQNYRDLAKAAVLEGNEDAPSKVDVYFDENPRYDQAPNKVFVQNEEGNLVEQTADVAGSKKTAIESPVRKNKDYGEEPFSAQERIDKIQTKLNGLEKKADAPSWVPVVELDNQTDYFKYSNALADAGIACSYEEKGGKHYVRIASDVLADATDKQKITEIIVTTGIGKNLLSEPAKKQESLEKKANDPYVVKEPNLALEEKLPFANLLEPRDVVEASDEDDKLEEEPEPELEYEFVYPKNTQESNELAEEYFDDPEAIYINEDELTAYYAGKQIAKITSEQYGSQGLDALAGPLYKWMEREQYWPSVILQGERDNQTVLSINKKGALDDFESRPIRDEEFEDSLGSRDTFATSLFANTEVEGGSDNDGDDGSAYSLLDGRNFSGVNEENAEGVVAEYLDGKAMSLASFEDFAGFVEDIYGISKDITSDYEDAWVDEDSRKLVACIMDNAVRNVIG